MAEKQQPCWKCSKPATQAGRLCKPCWQAMGKPEAAQAWLEWSKAQLLATGWAVPDSERPVGLRSEPEPLLATMKWVIGHAPEEDDTHQRSNVRRWLVSSSGAFYARMVELEKEESEKGIKPDVTSHLPAWDPEGKDRCPTCRRWPGVADPDDPITPEMSDDEVDEGIEKEFVKLTAFMRDANDEGEK